MASEYLRRPPIRWLPLSIRREIRRRDAEARRIGAAVRAARVPIWQVRDARDEENLRLLLVASLGADSTYVDVGTNTGKVLAMARQVAPEGNHVAFEPLPELAERLRRDFPRVEVVCAALADGEGVREFTRVDGAHALSGFEPPTDAVLTTVKGRADGVRLERIDVPVTTMDRALPAGVAPAFIKIDVEGAECAVLRGAAETVARYEPLVVFESAAHQSTPHGWSSEAIYDEVRRLGLRLFDIDGFGPLSLEQFVQRHSTAELWNYVARR